MQSKQVKAIELLEHPLQSGRCARCEAVVAMAEAGKGNCSCSQGQVRFEQQPVFIVVQP